jgi:hypothetical protein
MVIILSVNFLLSFPVGLFVVLRWSTQPTSHTRVGVAASGEEYRGADKSLARPTSLCILFDGENISFHAGLVIYIYIYIVLIVLQL